MVAFLIFLVLAFLLGSIPFAYIFVKKMRGVDVRTQGSGNAGATNAARILGKPMGLLILVLDALKGAAAAWALPLILTAMYDAAWLSGSPLLSGYLGVSGMALLLGLAAFLGHCFSPWLGFRGGKGVATALGVYLVVVPQAALLTLLVCLPILVFTRIVSLASLVGAVVLPVSIVFFNWRDMPWAVLLVTAGLSALVVFRHRANIGRLMQGKEKRI